MESNFIDEIKKKTSLVKFVVNTDTATDIISYLYKETERQKTEIDLLKQKLTEMNNGITNISNQDKYDQLSERIKELAIQMDKKIEESNEKINNFIKEKINDINIKTDSLSKNIGTNDFFPQSSVIDIFNQLNSLRTEMQALKKNTSEILGVEEKELSRLGTSRSNRLDGSNQNSDSENVETLATSSRSAKSSGLPSIPILQTPADPPKIKKERYSLQEIADQISRLKEEISQIKESNNKTEVVPTVNNNNNKISSRTISRIKKKEKETIQKEKKEPETKKKIESNEQDQELKAEPEKITKTDDENKKSIESFNSKIEDLTPLYQEIEKLKQALTNQSNQLKKIENTPKTGQVSLDDYIQEILQSAMKCDSESEKLTNDVKNLQNLLINSLQEIKERMDSMSDQFNEMATKEEVMAAFSEVINPKMPQNGTSIGVSRCKCLACGRTKPSVITTTDSNLAEILHYHPLASRNDSFRPGAKVTLLSREIPITSRTQTVSKDLITPRRPKTSRS